MKRILLLFLAIGLTSCGASKDGPNINNNGFIAGGYDVTEYFNDNAVEGFDRYSASYDGAKYKFANQGNLEKFEENPEKYQPQYDGWCAYAVGADNKKISINPKSYEIRDGKLYLFYDSLFGDTKKSWLEEGPEELQAKADENWKTLKNKGN